MKSDLMLWANLFCESTKDNFTNDMTDGLLINKIFGIIDERIEPDERICNSVKNANDRLNNWKIIVQNLRNYYLEVLQEVILVRPPNIVLVSKLPHSDEAHSELEKFLLYLLCAAVRCDRRDYFICQIMENLNPEVQTGIMTCIKNVTECSENIIDFGKLKSSDTDISNTFRCVINQLEDIYLEEITQLLDELNELQIRFSKLQSQYQIAFRVKTLSMPRENLNKEISLSTISLDNENRNKKHILNLDDNYNFCQNNHINNIDNDHHRDQNKLHAVSTSKLDQTCGNKLHKSFFNNSMLTQTNLTDVLFDESVGSEEFVVHDKELNLSNVQYKQCTMKRDSNTDVDDSVQIIQTDISNSTDAVNHLHSNYAEKADMTIMDMDKHHLSMELAEVKSKLRRANIEIEDQADQLAELHDQLHETRRELGQSKKECAKLANAAQTARHWQDEVDALKEMAERATALEDENVKLKKLLHETDYYKARCEQLTEDLNILSKENSEWACKTNLNEGCFDKVGFLEKELNKTRQQMTEIEQLRINDLDQMHKLHEELNKLKLETFNRIKTSELKSILSTPTEDSQLIDNFTLTKSNLNLSEQITESVTVKLKVLENTNSQLSEELNFLKSKLSETAEITMNKETEAEARLVEIRRENELLSTKLERLETAFSLQANRLQQLDLERLNFKTEAGKLRETFNNFKETTDKHLDELNKENSCLLDTIKNLRDQTNTELSTDERIVQLEKENSILGENAQTSTATLAKAELELSQLRSRITMQDDLIKRVDALTDERNQLSAELGARKREIAALKEACAKQSELEVELIKTEGNCTRLEMQLTALRSSNENQAKLETELVHLRQIGTKCDHLENALFDAMKKLAEVELERDDLLSNLATVKQKMITHRICDSGEDEADDEDCDLFELDFDKPEEIDSGNKTGDSTEETSPECLSVGRMRRKNMNVLQNLRHRDRRRRATHEIEGTKMDSDIKRLETERDAAKTLLKEAQSKLLEYETSKEAILKKETTDSVEEIKRLELELDQLRSTLKTVEQENRRLRIELRANELDQDNIRNGEAVLEKAKLLETQIKKLEENLKITESRYQECDQQRYELCQQLSIEQNTNSALRNELILEKIQLKQRNSELKYIQLGLEQCGLPKNWLEQFKCENNTVEQGKLLNLFMENLIGTINKSTENKLLTMQQRLTEMETKNHDLLIQMKQIEQNNSQIGKNTQHEDGANENLLIQLKDRVIELERENVRLETVIKSEKERYEYVKSHNQNLDIRITNYQEQLASMQNQLAELIGTNARLQVENTTLHSQVDSFQSRNSSLASRISEFENEIHHLTQLLENSQSSESQLTTNYEQLRNLHEQLTNDYDIMINHCKEYKDNQRHLKTELQSVKEQNKELLNNAEEVKRMRKALEQEKGTLKGEVKDIVILRENCSRLHSQLNTVNETLNRESTEKAATLERLHEVRRQLNESDNKVNHLTLELEKSQRFKQSALNETESLKARIELLTESNSKYEKENRALLKQLQSLLGQNQELLASTLESCETHVTQEGVLRERLLTMHRQKQVLEEKVVEQYRLGSSAKRSQRRLTLIEKARAVLNKRKDHNDPTKQSNFNSASSKLSQGSWSTDSRCSTPIAAPRLIPGSVSIYDRDPEEHDTGTLREFLKHLDTSANMEKNRSQTYRCKSALPRLHSSQQRQQTNNRQYSSKPYASTCTPSPDPDKCGLLRTNSDPKIESVGLMKTSNSSNFNSCGNRPANKLPYPDTDYTVQDNKYYSNHEKMTGNNYQFNGKRTPFLNSLGGWIGSEDLGNNGPTSGSDYLNKKLPATERCEKQVSEIVQIKATTDDTNQMKPILNGFTESNHMKLLNQSQNKMHKSVLNEHAKTDLITTQMKRSANSMSSGISTAFTTPLTSIITSNNGQRANHDFEHRIEYKDHYSINGSISSRSDKNSSQTSSPSSSNNWLTIGNDRPAEQTSNLLSVRRSLMREKLLLSLATAELNNTQRDEIRKPKVVLQYGDL